MPGGGRGREGGREGAIAGGTSVFPHLCVGTVWGECLGEGEGGREGGGHCWWY